MDYNKTWANKNWDDNDDISHETLEVMLSYFGWVKGWETIIHLVSKIDTFTSSTAIASELTAEGKYAAAPAEYSYYLKSKAKGYPVDWVWPEEGTSVHISYAGILKDARNKQNAGLWIDWLFFLKKMTP